MHDGKPLRPRPVFRRSADQPHPGAVDVSHRAFGVSGPDHLGRLFGQSPEQGFLVRQRGCALGYFLLQAGVELPDFLEQA